ncbi:MAG: nucleotidyltransferase family protein [Armatimonadetes bacterium]|nr:nucleotidyltransferase family protein [Armatimonadota bacterium]
MDFKLVTEKLVAAFRKLDVRYAVIGGFALGLWGYGRGTLDLDVLTNRDDLDKVDNIMQQLGYELKYRSENVSQYVSPLKIFGEVDFLHAFRSASLEMLARADEKEVFGGSLTIRVLRPEDLIGLKLQAMKNDPARSAVDAADIEALVASQGNSLSWPIIEEYCRILAMGDWYDKIRGRAGK